MTAPEPRDFNRFAIVPIYADSTGREAVPQNALFVGSQKVVMERILDSKARRQALTLINDAEHAKGTISGIRERERAVALREADVTAREDALARALLADALGKLDALTHRFDTIEAERAYDPDDDELPLPPMSDDGPLEALIKPQDQNALEPDLRSPAVMEDT
jgi:hypothetical protein